MKEEREREREAYLDIRRFPFKMQCNAGAIMLKINHTIKILRSIKVSHAAPENEREGLLKCMKSTLR